MVLSTDSNLLKFPQGMSPDGDVVRVRHSGGNQ
jgi:hypothetical protein